MKQEIAIWFSILLTTHCCFAGDFQTVNVEGIEGAIISAQTVQDWHDSIRRGRGAPHGIQNMLGIEAQSFWTPGNADIKTVESRLRNTLEKAAADPLQLDEYSKTESRRNYLKKEIRHILEHYPKYRRQYVGLIIKGKKFIYLNSFPKNDRYKYTKELIILR